jgi:hypothetical protein
MFKKNLWLISLALSSLTVFSCQPAFAQIAPAPNPLLSASSSGINNENQIIQYVNNIDYYLQGVFGSGNSPVLTWASAGVQQIMGGSDQSTFTVFGEQGTGGTLQTLITNYEGTSDFAHYAFCHNVLWTGTTATSTYDHTSTNYCWAYTDNGYVMAFYAPATGGSGAPAFVATPSYSLNLMNGTTTLATPLAVANGGTGASAFTQNSIPFMGASGALTQDNANLNWNDSTLAMTLGGTLTETNTLALGASNILANSFITTSSTNASAAGGAVTNLLGEIIVTGSGTPTSGGHQVGLKGWHRTAITAGNVPEAIANEGQLDLTGQTGGSITDAYAYQAYLSIGGNASANATNIYGFAVLQDSQYTGTVSNLYGVYVGPLSSVSGTVYSFYAYGTLNSSTPIMYQPGPSQFGSGMSIGTSSAGIYDLSIGASGTAGVRLNVGNGGSGVSNYMSFNGNRAYVGYNDTSSDAVVQGISGRGIELNVNNNTLGSGTALKITTTGAVGIGTTSPTTNTLLDVRGAVSSYGLVINASARAVNNATTSDTIAAGIASTYESTNSATITLTFAAPTIDGERRRVCLKNASTVTWAVTSPATAVAGLPTTFLAGQCVEAIYNSASGTPTNSPATTWIVY